MEVLWSVASGTFVALFFLLAVVAMEHLGPLERYSMRQRLPGFLMNAAGTALSIPLMWPLNWLWHRIGVAPALEFPLWRWLEPLGPTGYALQIAVLVVLGDFCTYWRHRAEHAWFWRIHVAHHAPRQLHAANDIGHPLQTILVFLFVAFPMSLIQADGPGTPFVVTAILGMASMYIHSPVQWHFGPLRRLFVDNRFHRIHHSIEERHYDKNFGVCFSVWDYMFGTAYEPGDEWPLVGVVGVPAPRTVADFLKLPLLTPGEEPEAPHHAVPRPTGPSASAAH